MGVKTWKTHLLSGLASVHPGFPKKECYRLIEQCNITLNLIRGCEVNPQLSAYTYVKGQFHFNETPIAPPGTNIMVHDTPEDCPSWASHAE